MKRPTHAGVTIPEIVVVAGIVALIGGAVWMFFGDIMSFTRSAQGGLRTQQELQTLTRRFSAELRAASQGDTGAYALATTSSSTISFYVDADNDGLKERIRYFKQGSDLRKGVLEPSGSPLAYTGSETVRTVMRDLIATTTPLFSYYDTDYAGTTTPLSEPVTASDVRLVKIVIVVDDDPTTPPESLIGTTQVSVRTIKDNL